MNSAHDDSPQRRQALDLQQSVCIRAPAGSGKTGLLIQRMLAALSRVEQPEAVLAITFTRKAAAEIQQRLVTALTQAQTQGRPPEAEHAQLTWRLAREVLQRDADRGWDLISNPNRIRATTIDAFNRAQASRMPLLAGLGSRPEPVDDASDLYREAVVNCFSRLQQKNADPAEREALTQVLGLADNRLDKLLDALSQMLATREQWLAACMAVPAHVRESGQRIIEAFVDARLQWIDSKLPRAAREEWLEALQQLASDGSEPWQFTLQLAHWPAAQTSTLAQWQALTASLLTGSGTWRKPRGLNAPAGFIKGHAATARAKALLDEFSACGDNVAAALAGLSRLPDEYPEALATRARALNDVLLQCCGELKLVFAAQRKADYSEMALGALQALADPSSGLAEREDARLRHLLVDEMQDTSEAQVRLLRLLTQDWQEGDGRSLFLVGDPQQSIYLFRQARVELFQDIYENGRLGHLSLKPLQLSRNFRSRPAIVEWCNRTMTRVFQARQSPVSFAPSLASRTSDAHAQVQVHQGSDLADEARQAVLLLQQTREQHPDWSIAVLARSRAQLLPLIEAMKQAKLPFSGQDLDPLDGTAVARNFLAAVRILHHPADDLAWARLLRSPGVGLSWADMDRLAATYPDCGWGRRVRERAPRLSEEGQRRLSNLQDALSELDARPWLRSRLPLAASWLHTRLGMRDDLQVPQKQDLLRIEQLLTEHCPEGSLQHPALFEAALKRLYSTPPSAPIELMTVHKSKGLEFEHVLLFNCNGGLRKGDTPLLRYHQQGQDWLLAPRPRESLQQDTPATRIYRMLAAEHQLDEDAEALRLFYVAATRAKERLDITLSPSAGGSRHNFAALLADSGLELELRKSREEKSPCWVDVQHPVLPVTQLHAARHPSLAVKVEQTAAAPSRLASPARDRVQAGLDWNRLEASLSGTVLHECLERLASHPQTSIPKHWPKAIRAGLKRRGLPAARIAPACDRILQLIRQALQGWGRWLLSEHPWSRNELAVSAWQDGRWSNAIIDRCFIDEQDRLWVADYKSNHPPDQQLGPWLDQQCAHYDAQLQSYVQLLEQLHGGRPARALLYFIDGDHLMARQAAGTWIRIDHPSALDSLFDPHGYKGDDPKPSQ